MKRLLVVGAALIATVAAVPVAHAATNSTDLVTQSTTNDLLNLIPGLGGAATRHICLVFEQLDTSYCIYVPLP